MDYPTTTEAFLSVAGVAIFGALVTQWLKLYLPDWRFTQLLTLAICEVFAVLATLVQSAWNPMPDNIWQAVMLGFFGACLATFGYEGVENIRGKLGAGPRADP